MSARARPVRTILPTAKLTAENAGDLVLTSHRRAVASASEAAPPPQQNRLSSPVSPTAELLPDTAPTRTSTKRPHAHPISHDPLIINNDADTTDVPEDAPKAKKPKTTPGQPARGLQTDVLIISIDDVEDLQSERLNKSDPTADVKEFFTAMPRAPGQDKGRTLCKLCS
jgi:hypothetical protein